MPMSEARACDIVRVPPTREIPPGDRCLVIPAGSRSPSRPGAAEVAFGVDGRRGRGRARRGSGSQPRAGARPRRVARSPAPADPVRTPGRTPGGRPGRAVEAPPSA